MLATCTAERVERRVQQLAGARVGMVEDVGGGQSARPAARLARSPIAAAAGELLERRVARPPTPVVSHAPRRL